MKTIISLSSALILISFSSLAFESKSFMPENNLKISIADKASNGMTEQRFNSIIDKVETIYSPIVKSRGGNLKINRLWTDDTVNANTSRSGKIWQVNMYGGLARHSLVTDDGFALVICHELGHQLGGQPKFSGFGNSWATVEGQSDYFAVLKCLRKTFESEDNESVVSKLSVDEKVITSCSDVYKSSREIALCKRVALAGLSLANLLSDLGGSAKVSFSTPDKTVVSRLYEKHPEAQCRLDTYFQAALCDKSTSDDIIDSDKYKGLCIQRDGFASGTRPLCWYKPNSEEI